MIKGIQKPNKITILFEPDFGLPFVTLHKLLDASIVQLPQCERLTIDTIFMVNILNICHSLYIHYEIYWSAFIYHLVIIVMSVIILVHIRVLEL